MKLVNIYRKWSESRFLKRHGCETKEQYDLRYDPDVDYHTSRITGFYRGYSHVYCFENHNHPIYEWDIAYDGIYLATEWSKKNLKGKFRFDFHRVTRGPSTAHEWEMDMMGGGDYIFFACQDSKDYSFFLLKWS